LEAETIGRYHYAERNRVKMSCT